MYIVKNLTNRICLTLTEKCTTNDSEFLIKMVNDTTGAEKIFAVDDTSEHTDRYNLFNVIENTTEDLSNGRVTLSPTGQWTYTVYEMASSSPRSLNPNLALATVETGRALVYDSTESQSESFETGETKNNPVFE